MEAKACKLVIFLLLISQVLFSQKADTSALNTLSKKEKKDGYRLLYDGHTSAGWRSATGSSFPKQGWEFSNGELCVLPPMDPGKHHGSGGDIVTTEKFAFFDLLFEYNISSGGNSGLKYFVKNEKGSSTGLELQLLDDSLHPDGKAGRDGNHTSLSLYDLITATKKGAVENPPGNWNRVRLIVYPDNRVQHYLNGIKVVEYVKGSEAFKELVAVSKYKTIPGFAENAEGYILLQDHGSGIRFRNIKIRSLK
ncbi:MAG: DUF1080 domain-containing protein [Chitinophagaceae bacterium]|nr:DUF1080 domain-containing protein [Chitinophagaceae bacterium]